MNVTSAQVHAGQAVYSKNVLRIYNAFVLGFSNRFLWRCPTEDLLNNYRKHISANHLDIGVGTGFFLEHSLAHLSTPNPRVTIMDLNPTVLDYCSDKVKRFRPQIYRHNILEPISAEIGKFDSVGINYLLHCLPGSLAKQKSTVFDHLKAVMNPNATLFGSTLLADLPRNWLTDKWMREYNRRGIFSVLEDCRGDLESALSKRFRDVKVDVAGSVGIFSCRLTQK